MKALYDSTVLECSKVITNRYSTSFSLGIKSLHKRFHQPIYAIYGFVRLADEIVDTFHEYDKPRLLAQFRADTWQSIDTGLSLNPVLHAFQLTVNQYKIERPLIEAFLDSMEMDLHNNSYEQAGYERYIYGSAEVVGLMCLRVFCEGDGQMYDRLKEPGRSLGAAFQKVNFLRDIKADFDERGRVYFPEADFAAFNQSQKAAIEADIQADFDAAYQGILALPAGARQGVYLAYVYYLRLFKKIRRTEASKILSTRIRVPDSEKFYLLLASWFRGKLNVL